MAKRLMKWTLNPFDQPTSGPGNLTITQTCKVMDNELKASLQNALSQPEFG